MRCGNTHATIPPESGRVPSPNPNAELTPEPPEMARGPLAGVLVADFSRVVAGPLVAMSLADLGATAVKVEHPSGDDTRRWGPPWFDAGAGPESSYSTAVNRNKRSIRLDLSDPADLSLARELARRADVVVENFRPGTMARFGLDHHSISLTNPGVTTVSIDGFGDSGAGRDLPGYDLVAQAASGLMALTGDPQGPPTKVGVAIVDVLAALQATIGTLASLVERERTGTGRHVQVSLFDAALAGLINQAAAVLTTGQVPGRLGNDHPSIAPYSTFATGAGHLVIAVGNDRQFAALAELLGHPEWADDRRFRTNGDRVMHRNDLRGVIESELISGSAEQWLIALAAVGIPSGPVNDMAQAIAFAHELGLDPVLTTERPDGTQIRTIASPIRFTPDFDRPHRAPPLLGQDDDALRQWLASPPPG